MDPNQTPAPQTPVGYPPQPATPPQVGYPQAPPQQPVQPYAQAPQFNPAQPPSQPAAATSWYTPAPKPDANRPSDASAYLQAAGVGAPGQTPQAPGHTVPGQVINGQYSVDYLNQMSTGVKQPLDKKFIYLGAGLALALMLAAALLFMRPKTVSDDVPVKLFTTMVDTEKSTARSGKLIKSSRLSSINGNIRTLLTNAQRDMDEPLTKSGQKTSSLKSAAIKPPYHDDKFAGALEDARLNAVYDRVYANEINTKLKYIVVYMESIKKSNRSQSMQVFVDKNLPSFQTLQKSVEDYQASEEASRY